MTVIVKPKGRGNWRAYVWTLTGTDMISVRPGTVLLVGGVTWRVCEVRP